MAKVTMTCPISRGLCVDCGIYRGRHYYMCYSKEYGGCLIDPEKARGSEQKKGDAEDPKFGMPDSFHISSTCIRNPEERLMDIYSESQSRERREG